MNETKFRIGDKIVFNTEESMERVLNNKAGTVKSVVERSNEPEKYLVEFDEEDKSLHDGNGVNEIRTKPHKGWWCNEHNLTPKRLGD